MRGEISKRCLLRQHEGCLYNFEKENVFQKVCHKTSGRKNKKKRRQYILVDTITSQEALY